MIRLLFNAAAFIPMRVGICWENKNFSAVIPAQAGIRTRSHGNLHRVIPTKVGIQNAGLEKPFYPISFRTDRPRFPPSRE